MVSVISCTRHERSVEVCRLCQTTSPPTHGAFSFESILEEMFVQILPKPKAAVVVWLHEGPVLSPHGSPECPLRGVPRWTPADATGALVSSATGPAVHGKSAGSERREKLGGH